MKRFIKNNLKVFVAIVISGIVFTGIGVYAASQYFAKDITFIPTNENFKKENGEPIENVEDALNELYKKSISNFAVFTDWKSVSSWNDHAFLTLNYLNRNFIRHENTKIIFEENGKYKLYTSIRNASTCSTSPQLKVFKNDVEILNLTNDKIGDTMTSKTIDIDINENDIIYGNIYGCGNNGVSYFTIIVYN